MEAFDQKLDEIDLYMYVTDGMFCMNRTARVPKSILR